MCSPTDNYDQRVRAGGCFDVLRGVRDFCEYDGRRVDTEQIPGTEGNIVGQ